MARNRKRPRRSESRPAPQPGDSWLRIKNPYPPIAQFSEDEIEARRLQMVANGQTRMVDFAMRYAGLGHVIVLSYDPEGDKVFARLDGGSNTYDRVINLERAIAMDPSRTPHSFSTRECIRRIIADEPIEV